jgi:hypothetical protein
MFAYARNNPINSTDSEGEWVVDVAWLLADVYAFAKKPTVGNAMWILVSIASFADPSGTLSTALHALKGSRKATQIFRKAMSSKKLSGKFKRGAKKGCNCFTAGTKVMTDEGEKNIEDIEIGDKVLAKSDETGDVAYKEVTGLFQKQSDEIYSIYIGKEVIEATKEHPVWIDGRGWTEVHDLKVGDLLVTSNGHKIAIEKIKKEPRQEPVYNFSVEDYESYFVSNLGIWVHNCPANIEKILKTQKKGKTTKLTNPQAKDLAKYLGFTKVEGAKSNGELVFSNGKVFITLDNTSHNGGVWKMAKTIKNLGSDKTRMGTYDALLNYIKK